MTYRLLISVIVGLFLYLSLKPINSLETLDRHDQTHNDIKPQNFLVKFKNGQNDLTQMEIALTDFGMAEADSKGGTPIFASPECFEKKEKKSDIYSFGRVILFLLLTKKQFVKWLFVPIKDKTRALSLYAIRMTQRFSIQSYGMTVIVPAKQINWITQMMGLKNRTNLQSARELFNDLRQKKRIKLRTVSKLVQTRWCTQLIINGVKRTLKYQFEYPWQPGFGHSD